MRTEEDDEREALIARTIEEHSEVMDYGDGTGYCECGGQATPTGRQPKNGPPFVYWTPEHQAHEVAVALGRLSPLTQEALAESVFQALGEVSVCWSGYPSLGVFDSTRARQIGDELMAKLSRFSLLEPAEVEWEYGCRYTGNEYPQTLDSRETAERYARTIGGVVFRRRAVGPWLPVEEGTK